MNILQTALNFSGILSVVLKNIKVKTWKLCSWSANVTGLVFSLYFPQAVRGHYT